MKPVSDFTTPRTLMLPISRHFFPVEHPDAPCCCTTGLKKGSRLPFMAHFLSSALSAGLSSGLSAGLSSALASVLASVFVSALGANGLAALASAVTAVFASVFGAALFALEASFAASLEGALPETLATTGAATVL